MVDRDPVPSWNQGRVTLLGDSAHPMYPIGSNGASQAILDAQALVDALDQAATFVSGGSEDSAGVASEAVALYEQQRLPSTAAIVKANRGNGPEQCMQLAHERAPDGFDSLGAIFADGELQAIADQYKQLTGMAQRKG